MIQEFERDKIISYLMAKYPNKPVSVKFLNGEDGTYKKMFLESFHLLKTFLFILNLF